MNRQSLAVLALVALPIHACGDASGDADDRGDAAGSGGHDGGGDPWSDCSDAAVFGVEGEACSFTESCAECARIAPPRQAACVSGRLRFAAVGPGSCDVSADAGIRDGGIDCSAYVFAFPPGRACSGSAATCWQESGDTACLEAEPACFECVRAELAACATRSGCDDEAGALRCCAAARCPAGGACTEEMCATELAAYVGCASSSGCAPTRLCFPEVDPCAPTRYPAPTPACAAATRACLDEATTGSEEAACIDADPAAARCQSCLLDDLAHCATDPALADSCDDALGQLGCCVAAACPSGAPACRSAAQSAGGACWDETVAFADCVNAQSDRGACEIGDACFAAP